MDWADTPEQARFREEVRRFIAERFPRDYRPDPDADESIEPDDVPGYNWPADRKSDDPERRRAAIAWADALAEKGWVAPHWPREYGGGGLSHLEQFILAEEMAKAGVPPVGGIGVGLVGPTLIAHGTEEQKQRHLPRILSGEVAWSQGFSEPAAGSDLAALQMRAVRQGDEYVLDGQKIWTSGAQYADWMCVLVRTDPQAAPKHRGITFLLVDLDTPGISVRPLEDMTWNQPFNESFFEEVRVPVEHRVGEENRGWYVGMAMLDFERSGIGGAVGYRKALDDLVRCVRARGEHPYLRADWRHATRHEIAQRRIEVELVYQFAFRTVHVQASGGVPNIEASVSKLFMSETHQRLANTGTKAFGLYGNLWQREGAPLDAAFTHDYLVSSPHTVFSGSSEIQRRVIATRGLGLPRGD